MEILEVPEGSIVEIDTLEELKDLEDGNNKSINYRADIQ